VWILKEKTKKKSLWLEIPKGIFFDKSIL
jgi:hypothetical protein